MMAGPRWWGEDAADGGNSHLEKENDTMTYPHKFVLASFVGSRDGMALELHHPDGHVLAEVFEDDRTKVRTVSFYTTDPVPLEDVEELIDRARRHL